MKGKFAAIIFVLISKTVTAALESSSIPTIRYLMPDFDLAVLNQPDTNSRIINGNTAEPHAFPYQVAIEIYTEKETTFCGGAILSQEWILTAAHCLVSATHVNLVLGAHDRRNRLEKGQIRVEAVKKENFRIHEQYGNFRHDIALIKLPYPIKFTEQILPISLPFRAHQNVKFDLSPAIATGWGYVTGQQNMARYLLYIDVKIQQQEECIRYLKPWILDSHICIDGSDGKGSCYGDSGSPLATTGSIRYVIGIASFIGASGCEAKGPSAYTRVTSYLDWISTKTGIKIY